MLDVRYLTKSYLGRKVLKDISFSLEEGAIYGLIGRSGVGKSTLARCLVGLEKPESGTFKLEGHAFKPGQGAARKDIQYLWQDASGSLSPYLSAHAAVLEALDGFSIGVSKARAQMAQDLLSELGISLEMQSRRPHALSGGQCQRVALARALAAQPKLLILDEPLSALDLMTQNRTIELLKRVHHEKKLTMLIVSHDLAPLQKLSSQIFLLQNGTFVKENAIPHFLGSASV